MSHRTWVYKPRLAAAAIVVTTAGAVMLPPPQAHAACAAYQFPQMFFEIIQNDGWHVTFPVSGNPRRTTGPGNAEYWMSGKRDPSKGEPHGGMNELGQIDIEVPWNNGSVGKFIGNVRSDGFAEGRSSNLLRPEHNFTWKSVQPMDCYAPPGGSDAVKEQEKRAQQEILENQPG